MQKGIYNLLIELDRGRRLKVGMLGTFWFPKGYYIYTGSSQNNMEKRLARHLSRRKKMHWHIDYLLKVAKVIKIIKHTGLKNDECRINRKITELPNTKIIAQGFGSSDCKCKTHLLHFSKPFV